MAATRDIVPGSPLSGSPVLLAPPGPLATCTGTMLLSKPSWPGQSASGFLPSHTPLCCMAPRDIIPGSPAFRVPISRPCRAPSAHVTDKSAERASRAGQVKVPSGFLPFSRLHPSAAWHRDIVPGSPPSGSPISRPCRASWRTCHRDNLLSKPSWPGQRALGFLPFSRLHPLCCMGTPRDVPGSPPSGSPISRPCRAPSARMSRSNLAQQAELARSKCPRIPPFSRLHPLCCMATRALVPGSPPLQGPPFRGLARLLAHMSQDNIAQQAELARSKCPRIPPILTPLSHPLCCMAPGHHPWQPTFRVPHFLEALQGS
jgi:hypothetical protein